MFDKHSVHSRTIVFRDMVEFKYTHTCVRKYIHPYSANRLFNLEGLEMSSVNDACVEISGIIREFTQEKI